MNHIAKEKAKLLNRLKRMRGQIEAMERAVDGDNECAAVLQQATACRGALDGFIAEVIEDHIREHMVDPRESRDSPQVAAAEELEVNAADLETDGRGNIHVKGAPHRSISTKDVAIAAQFKQGKTISGRGIFLVPLSAVDPETGEMSPATCYAHACMVAEVEVDDETGEVAMVRMDSAYELGRALNPRLVEQQLVGGAWMGISHALYETPEPYYPDPIHGPRDFVEYVMPGPGDICPHDIAVLERPAADGPFGAKGPGEMCANPVLPAVANAIFNAVGVRMDELPITPEKVLRAIKSQGGARPQMRR